MYPNDIDQQTSDDLSLRQMFCHFLATVLLIALARAEDNIEVQLQDYLIIRKHVDSFDTGLQEKLEKLEEGPAEDLIKNFLSSLLMILRLLSTFKSGRNCWELYLRQTYARV
jgi:hypothetical protein